ncbi:FAD/NAD(P)-binding domain-containing protein [uncultured Agrococcus sp.]|uniref:FAD/NAD(P)-binding protein n=1 Tax=uncultured Agrococcus sp. TaxID=382258 RepID=UPI0025D6CF06|nr:FAD/NAD(P)-binding protein [uncultured Agrococcus sp.]
MTPDDARFDAVFVGGGPRAVATVVRLVDRLRDAGESQPVRVAIIDAVEIAAGATWRTDQPAEYLNNTTVAATTIHPDDSTRMTGPAAPGPSLADWISEIEAAGAHPFASWVAEEAQGLRPADFPTRRLQGVYYRDRLDAAIASGLAEVTEVLGSVVDLVTAGDLRRVLLADGSVYSAPSLVLAQGMVQALPTLEEQALQRAASDHGLTYIAPGMPAEQPWDLVFPNADVGRGDTVLVRGLGANFFDVVGHLSRQWGGRFERVDGDAFGRLRYVASGREPKLVAGSRRGFPYRSKPDGDAVPAPFEPRYTTREWFDELGEREGLSLQHDVFPTLAAEFAYAHLSALERWAPDALEPGWSERLDAASGLLEVESVLEKHVLDERYRWLVDELRRPTRGEHVGQERWRELVRRHVEDELGSMTQPSRHPRAAVNRVMSMVRGSVSKLAVVGALSGDSAVHDLHGWFDGDALFMASGPPSSRTREVLALIEAGVIELIGPETKVEFDEEERLFRLSSPVSGRRELARTLVETRMSKGKVPGTSDPLLRSLLETGRARIHTIEGVPTASLDTTLADIDEAVSHGFNLVDADGNPDRRVIVLGIPAGSTQPGSAIGATPGKSSPLLAGADIAAKQILAARRDRG